MCRNTFYISAVRACVWCVSFSSRLPLKNLQNTGRQARRRTLASRSSGTLARRRGEHGLAGLTSPHQAKKKKLNKWKKKNDDKPGIVQPSVTSPVNTFLMSGVSGEGNFVVVSQKLLQEEEEEEVTKRGEATPPPSRPTPPPSAQWAPRAASLQRRAAELCRPFTPLLVDLLTSALQDS